MASNEQIHPNGAAAPPSRTLERGQTVWAPSKGVYLTDETSLFRVAEVLSSRRELLLELEDCSTFELVLCPARRLAQARLRTVAPAV